MRRHWSGALPAMTSSRLSAPIVTQRFAQALGGGPAEHQRLGHAVQRDAGSRLGWERATPVALFLASQHPMRRHWSGALPAMTWSAPILTQRFAQALGGGAAEHQRLGHAV